VLTEKQKGLLRQLFGQQDIKELTQQQTEEIATQAKIPLRAVEWFALDCGLVPRRYQANIGSLGIDGQKRLLQGSAIVVGLGGLGGYVIEQLARAGLGQITGADPDIFDETNLNRQLLAEQGNLGENKVDKARRRVEKVNKAVEFTGYALPFDQLTEELWRSSDLVFDCLDNIEDRLNLVKKCSTADKPLIHGAVAGWYGQIAVVWPGSRTLEKIYHGQSRGIEKDLGNPPFTPAAVASLMVAEGIKILMAKTSKKEKKMLFFDLLDGQWQTITA